MMDWVAAFYARQYEPLDEAGAWEIQPMHREIAASVRALVSAPARVLELGAGGGQAAAALADLGYDVVANELLPQVAARVQQLATVQRAGPMTVLPGNFYGVEPQGKYDLAGTGLRLVDVRPDGSCDAAADHFDTDAPLERAMSYVATLAAAS